MNPQIGDLMIVDYSKSHDTRFRSKEINYLVVLKFNGIIYTAFDISNQKMRFVTPESETAMVWQAI